MPTWVLWTYSRPVLNRCWGPVADRWSFSKCPWIPNLWSAQEVDSSSWTTMPFSIIPWFSHERGNNCGTDFASACSACPVPDVKTESLSLSLSRVPQTLLTGTCSNSVNFLAIHIPNFQVVGQSHAHSCRPLLLDWIHTAYSHYLLVISEVHNLSNMFNNTMVSGTVTGRNRVFWLCCKCKQNCHANMVLNYAILIGRVGV